MRYLLCLAGGVLIGALLALTAASTLQRRNAWPRAVMNVMQHELGQARETLRLGRCADASLTVSRSHLALLSDDLERALLDPGTKDRVFAKYAQDLRDTVAAWDPQAECGRQAEALSAVSQACDACHRDYR
ncbi:hypothetical protein [Dokdonella ginsengisoli]|uniref:Cytochrome c n=1 Tax=Dokdonella ginsengisoli TaxID=363846 RepID=A0ABV9QT63_9GAMM